MISVVIATRNRSETIKNCINSLLKNSYRNFEIIIIDQSTDDQTKHIVQQVSALQIHYHRLYTHGKSRALNEGLKLISGQIVAFTDDDCIVSLNWLRSMYHILTTHQEIAGVFGKTLPYQWNKHPKETCPCTFVRTTAKKFSRPAYHPKHWGYGNNMAFRTSALKQIGGFKPWLGPGSIGDNAEDAELANHLLIMGEKLLFTPKMIVYHNKWLDSEQMKQQILSYTCGEMACYGYFYFQGYGFAKTVIMNNVSDSFHKLKHIIRQVFVLQWNTQLLKYIYTTTIETIYRVRGLFIGYLFSLIDPVRHYSEQI